MSAKQTKQIEIEQPISDNEELSNDGPAGAPSLSRSKLNLKKFGEDELLGDMATQAMHLFSNLNFPNLKNEIPGLNFSLITWNMHAIFFDLFEFYIYLISIILISKEYA